MTKPKPRGPDGAFLVPPSLQPLGKADWGGARPNPAHVAEWTPAQDDELSVLRAEGLSTQAIASRISRSQGVVARRCRHLNLPTPPELPKPPPRESRPTGERVLPPRPAGLITLPPLPSLQEPMYIIPKR